jgi:CBS domain containing-hemolysin-like protein
MSGGVDSSVAALLTKQKGDDCIGATMQLFHNEDIGERRDKACCSLDDVNDATHLDLHSDDYDSIGGYLIEQLGHLAVRGDRVETQDGLILIADKVNRNRILKVRIILPDSNHKQVPLSEH